VTRSSDAAEAFTCSTYSRSAQASVTASEGLT